jgi:hypothetical protein
MEGHDPHARHAHGKGSGTTGAGISPSGIIIGAASPVADVPSQAGTQEGRHRLPPDPRGSYGAVLRIREFRWLSAAQSLSLLATSSLRWPSRS